MITPSSAQASAPTWEELKSSLDSASDTAKRLESDAEARARGEGPPHQDNKLRLFGAMEEEIRVTFYRDHAGVSESSFSSSR